MLRVVALLTLALSFPAWGAKHKKPLVLVGPHVLAAPVAAEYSSDGKHWKRVTGNLKLPGHGWLKTHQHDSVQFDLGGARVTLFSRSLVEWRGSALELLFGEARVVYQNVEGGALRWVAHALDWAMRPAGRGEALKHVPLDPIEALWVSAPDRSAFQARLAGERGEIPAQAVASKKEWDRAVYVMKGNWVGSPLRGSGARSVLAAGEAWISEQGDIPGRIRKVDAGEIRATLDAL